MERLIALAATFLVALLVYRLYAFFFEGSLQGMFTVQGMTPFYMRATHWLTRCCVNLIRLHPKSLLAEAQRRAGLEDFGDSLLGGKGLDGCAGERREGLRVQCKALEGEARLSLVGRLAVREDMLDTLTSRLQIVDYLKV